MMDHKPTIGAAPVAALQEQYEALDRMDPAEYAAAEKKLVRKIDIRLMPMLILMIVLKYAISIHFINNPY